MTYYIMAGRPASAGPENDAIIRNEPPTNTSTDNNVGGCRRTQQRRAAPAFTNIGTTTTAPPVPRSLLVSSLLLILVSAGVRAEIRTFTGSLDPAPTYIHYSDGYLVAPGSVDLSPLVFFTPAEVDDSSGPYKTRERGGDKNDTETLEGDYHREDDNGTAASERDRDDDTGGGDRWLWRRAADETGDDVVGEDDDGGGVADDDFEDEDYTIEETMIDIALFRQPRDCIQSDDAKCDWTELGVGASDDEGNLRWCCWDDASDLGLCKDSKADHGRLIINATRFQGEYRTVVIPATGEHEVRVSHPKIDVPDDSGTYILVMANCNGHGRSVSVSGSYVWESVHGYLPGDLFGEMYFFVALVVVYLVLFLWYGISMSIYSDNTIPIQKWILVTIFMGLLETFFKAGDLWVWNVDGTRFWFAMYFGVILGVVKRAISRCLVLMVSLGWGVVRDTLDDQLRKIVVLGVVYLGVAIARDVIAIIAVVDMQTISIEEEVELFDTVTILTFIVAFIDVTFYMWILDSLNGTMQYLENMNQNVKLLRYLRLRLVLLLSILFAIAWAVFGIVDNYMETSILDKTAEWSINALWEMNYLFVLTSVAILWRPNDAAKQFAFVMELPSVGGDVEFTTNDGVEEDDDDGVNGSFVGDDLKGDEVNGNGESLKIDSAVHS